MKRIIFKVVFCLQIILLANNLFAQDVIVLKSGDEIKSKVLEVSTDQIKYKKWENIDGPDYSSLKSDVFMIKYQNGTKEVFKSQESSKTSIVPASSNDEKKNDAFETLNKFFKNRFNNDKVFIMLVLDKSNGVLKNVNGQSVYEIDYKLKLEFISDAWVKSFYGRVYFDKNFTTYDKEPVINVFGTTTSNSYLFNKGKIYTFSGTATMENTDNGYILKDYDIKGVDYVGMDSKYNSQNSSQNYNNNQTGKANEENKSLTTHKGHFYNKISALNYYERLIVNSDHKFSSKEKLCYRSIKDKIVTYALFGKMGINKDDEWVYKTGDTLSLKIDVDGLDFLKVKFNGFKYNGEGDFVLLTQIEDGEGNEYYSDSTDLIIKKSEKSVSSAFVINVPIKISPDKLILTHPSRDLFLSFLLLGKQENNSIVEGFVKLKVE